MDNLLEFLSMGGYWFYVWSSYALTALLLIGIIVWSARRFRISRDTAFRRAHTQKRKHKVETNDA